MITESYSEEREALFSPGAFLGERKYLCDTAIATFSGEIYQAVIDKYPHREVGNISSANGRKPIYAIEINGKEIVFYLSSIGACLAGIDIIEMQWQTQRKIYHPHAGVPRRGYVLSLRAACRLYGNQKQRKACGDI